MINRNVKDICNYFKHLSNDDRLESLQTLMQGPAELPSDLTWRAHLCTALREAEVYPLPPDMSTGEA